jgi:hypothetical protein
MADKRKIFSKSYIGSDTKAVQKVKYNREQLLSKTTAEELNTYLNFGVFPTFADTFIPWYEDGKLSDATPPGTNKNVGKIGTPGVRSLFNRVGAIMLGSSNGAYDVDITKGDVANTHYWRISNNVPLMDSVEARRRIRQSSGCSIKELVEASQQGLMGQETYAYSDFMYCKHLGKMSNNHLITLRRFPLPIDDYIGTTGEDDNTRLNRVPNNAACIGCMVTWMGVSGNELSNILKYSYKMSFKEETAEFQDKKASADDNTKLLNSMFSVFDKEYQKQYQAGFAGEAANSAFEHLGIKLGEPPYKSSDYTDFRDRTKVYGPVDSIRSTYIRGDEGLTFDHKITLTFEYELKSYNGINGKQAMLDLISNILNVTYTTGTFWGGGFKGYASHQSNVFANLNIFKARGGFTNFIDAFSEDVSTISDSVKAAVGKIESIGDALKALGGFVNNMGGMVLSGMLNKLGRPQKAMYNALLSPAPIGFWHVTIGNPKRPIMSIGNMIITDCNIEHYGPLGIDDFPTGLKVTVSLDRGKPRDIRDIEKLYMQGTDRIYSSMGDKVFDMYKNAELYQSHKKSGTLSSYKPVSNTAKIELPTDHTSEPKVTVQNYSKLQNTMKKYFGTTDTYSIYVPAAEQEYGSGKPSTKSNERIAGKENGK